MSRGEIIARREKPGKCGACDQRGNYSVEPAPADRRPMFRCSNCGHEWTCGLIGKGYLTASGYDAFRREYPRHAR